MSNTLFLFLIGCLAILPTSRTQEFGYVPEIGPTNWSTIDPSWAICGDGLRQSPIDVTTAEAEDSTELHLILINEELTVTGTLENNQHAVEFHIDSSDSTRPVFAALYGRPNNFPDAVYVLQQFHFHWSADDNSGSENQIDGRSSVAEVHFVTQNILFNSTEAVGANNGFLVLGILLRVCETSNLSPIFGQNNEYLSQVRAYPDNVQNISLKLEDIYSCDGPCTDKNRYYVFQGSFTTPPCTEAVIWWLAQDMMCISQAQLDMLRTQNVTAAGPALVSNTRPIQDLNQRTILINVLSSVSYLLI